MKKFLTLCLVLLTAAALTVPAYADVIAEPAPGAGNLLVSILVIGVVAVTIRLLLGLGSKKK